MQIDKEHVELSHANFSILKKEAQGILDLVRISFYDPKNVDVTISENTYCS